MLASISIASAGEADTRSLIRLSPQHRTLVLTEMRQFLSGLQQITDALSRDDMETVAREALTLGAAMSHHMPADLKQALPLEFRKLGHAVHSSFDQIALDAESLGDSRHSLSQWAIHYPAVSPVTARIKSMSSMTIKLRKNRVCLRSAREQTPLNS